MPSIKSLLVGAAAAAAAVGLAGAAMAAGSHLHTLTVNLPDGGVAVIHYAGDVPPKVTLTPGMALPAAWGAGPFGPAWAQPFADLDRIAAQMDRQANAMLSQALNAAPMTAPGRLLASFGRLPPGAQSFSFVSNGVGANVCGRSTEVIAQGAGKAPRVISHTWGHCAAGAAAPTVGLAPDTAGPVGGTTVLGPPEIAAPAAAAPHLTVASLDR